MKVHALPKTRLPGALPGALPGNGLPTKPNQSKPGQTRQDQVRQDQVRQDQVRQDQIKKDQTKYDILNQEVVIHPIPAHKKRPASTSSSKVASNSFAQTVAHSAQLLAKKVATAAASAIVTPFSMLYSATTYTANASKNAVNSLAATSKAFCSKSVDVTQNAASRVRTAINTVFQAIILGVKNAVHTISTKVVAPALLTSNKVVYAFAVQAPTAFYTQTIKPLKTWTYSTVVKPVLVFSTNTVKAVSGALSSFVGTISYVQYGQYPKKFAVLTYNTVTWPAVATRHVLFVAAPHLIANSIIAPLQNGVRSVSLATKSGIEGVQRAVVQAARTTITTVNTKILSPSVAAVTNTAAYILNGIKQAEAKTVKAIAQSHKVIQQNVLPSATQKVSMFAIQAFVSAKTRLVAPVQIAGISLALQASSFIEKVQSYIARSTSAVRGTVGI